MHIIGTTSQGQPVELGTETHTVMLSCHKPMVLKEEAEMKHSAGPFLW